MSKVIVNGQEHDYELVEGQMDPELVDDMEHSETTLQGFVDRYCEYHEEEFGEPFHVTDPRPHRVTVEHSGSAEECRDAVVRRVLEAGGEVSSERTDDDDTITVEVSFS